MTETYEVGKFYIIPTITWTFFSREDIWPVLGPAHEDAEIIGFPHWHYHLDYRFFNKRQWAHMRRWHGLYTLQRQARLSIFAHVLVGMDDAPLPRPMLRRRKCQRATPFYPPEVVPWLPALEEAYQARRLGAGWICPHRGASLRGQPVREGVVVCPLHGLRWCVETGRLVPWGQGSRGVGG